MKTRKVFLMILIPAFLLGACVGDAGAAQLSQEEIMSGAYTAVALTGISRIQTAKAEATSTPIAPTPAPSQSPTMTATVTATLFQPLITPAATGSYDSSAYVDDVNIPDGTVFAPGEVFTKTWKIRNNGASIWNKYYAITFSSGDSMSGTTTTLRRAIPPNGNVNISVELTAPEKEGTYTGCWVMTNSSGGVFGNIFYVQIVVMPNKSSDE